MLRERIQQHQITAFLIVAIGWTWGWHALFNFFGIWDLMMRILVPAPWGPLLGAVVVVWASDGSLRTWFSRRLRWRLHPGLYLAALLIPIAIGELHTVIEAAGGGTITYNPPAEFHLMVVFLLLNMVIWGGSEEFGWRGFLQPRLQQRLSVLTAGLVIGVIWWVWHLPMYFSDHPEFSFAPLDVVRYGVFILGLSVVLAAVANLSDGSVLPANLMHSSTNLGAFFAASGGVLTGSPIIPIVSSALWWVIVLVLVVKYGRSMVPAPSLKPIV